MLVHHGLWRPVSPVRSKYTNTSGLLILPLCNVPKFVYVPTVIPMFVFFFLSYIYKGSRKMILKVPYSLLTLIEYDIKALWYN